MLEEEGLCVRMRERQGMLSAERAAMTQGQHALREAQCTLSEEARRLEAAAEAREALALCSQEAKRVGDLGRRVDELEAQRVALQAEVEQLRAAAQAGQYQCYRRGCRSKGGRSHRSCLRIGPQQPAMRGEGGCSNMRFVHGLPGLALCVRMPLLLPRP